MEAVSDLRDLQGGLNQGHCRAPGRDDPTSQSEWRKLFAALAEGEREAYERVYDLMANTLYGLALWRIGNREDAEDVVHDTFVRVAERRSLLRTVRNPRTWLLTVCNRLAIDRIRKRSRRRSEPLEEHCLLELDAVDPEQQLDGQKAARALAQLPGPQREAIYLRHFGPCTFSEIGDVVGTSTFTAASRYRLGMRKLRRLLGVSS
jgi:RNA polymerase sigma-70 factor (ECF subfamily)